jgi:anti-sigma factor RsiW
VQCAEALRVQAYFDGEVDAVSATQIERHIEHCPECRLLLQDLNEVRTKLKDVPFTGTPPALRARVMRALDQEQFDQERLEQEKVSPRPARTAQPSRVRRAGSYWTGALSGFGGAALAASLAFFLLTPRPTDPLINDLVSSHVRSLMPDHLIDVVSSDRHTVKPWFAGHADVSPTVVDFESQGYRLVGGRADFIDHQRSAVIVYQHGAHTINVFSWAAADHRLPANTTRSGYHLAFWQQGDIQYCAVSDTGWDELLGLTRLMREP